MSSGGLFSFRPELGETPETLKRRRAVIEAMMSGGAAPTTIGGGLSSFGSSIAGALMQRQLSRQEAAGQASAAATFAPLLGGGGGHPEVEAALAGSNGSDTMAGSTGGSRYQDAIAGIESGGRYDIVGPRHKTLGRALGKYQVMEANVGPWSREALGRTVSADEFLANPQIQDRIFDAKFGQYVAKYGPEGAARAWFGGPGNIKNAGAKDVFGTTVGGYGQRFMKSLGGSGGGAPAVADALAGGIGGDTLAGPVVDPRAKDDLYQPVVAGPDDLGTSDPAYRKMLEERPMSGITVPQTPGAAPLPTAAAAPVAPAMPPAAPPVAPGAPAAPGVAPVARALGVDPLPQTSGLVGPVASAGHDSLAPGGQAAVTAALAGGGGTDALAGGGGRGFLGRLFGPRPAAATATPAAAPGGGGGVPSAAVPGETAALPGTEPVSGTPAAAGGFSPRALAAIEYLRHPWADQNKGMVAVAQAILEQEIAQADPKYRRELEKIEYDLAVAREQDPVKLAKLKLDYEQAQNPELIPPTQAEAAQIARSKAQTELDKQQQQLAKDRLQFDISNAKSTTDIKNYDAWAADERAAGREPSLTRLQYEQELRKAGAPTTELKLTDTAEEAEAKERGKGAVAMFTKFTDDAPDAEAFAISANRLGQLASAIDPGTEAGLIDWFRQQTGMEIGEGADKIQAFQAMVSYMAPRMRPPGSGAASDFDARQFLGSLPSLLGTPRGNRLAVETLSGMGANRLALVHISQDYMAGVITKEEALKQMRSLPDPFAAFKEEIRPDDPVPDNIDLSQKEWDMLTEDEKSDLQEGVR